MVSVVSIGLASTDLSGVGTANFSSLNTSVLEDSFTTASLILITSSIVIFFCVTVINGSSIGDLSEAWVSGA